MIFSLYTSPVGQLVSSYGISHQQYADDTQLFISIPQNRWPWINLNGEMALI